MRSMQGEWVCFKDSKNILHEILHWRAREGRAMQHSRFGQLWPDSTSVRPNWLCFLARPSHALHSRISCKIFFGILEAYPFTLFRSHLWTSKFYLIPPQHIVVTKKKLWSPLNFTITLTLKLNQAPFETTPTFCHPLVGHLILREVCMSKSQSYDWHITTHWWFFI